MLAAVINNNTRVKAGVIHCGNEIPR